VPYLPRALRRQFSIMRLLLLMERVESRAKERIAKINEEKEARLKELKEKALRAVDPLVTFFEANREVLPTNAMGTKATTEAGSHEWYPGVPSIEVVDAERAIAALERGGHEEALRRT